MTIRALLGALLVTVLGSVPAGAHHGGSHTSYVFRPPLMCAAACPGVVSAEAACAPDPLSVPLSWQEIQVRATETTLRFELFPQIDYDMFVCRVTPDPAGAYLVAASMKRTGESDCDNLISSRVPIGCYEHAVVTATVGEVFLFRAFNFSDQAPAVGRVTGAERA